MCQPACGKRGRALHRGSKAEREDSRVVRPHGAEGTTPPDAGCGRSGSATSEACAKPPSFPGHPLNCRRCCWPVHGRSAPPNVFPSPRKGAPQCGYRSRVRRRIRREIFRQPKPRRRPIASEAGRSSTCGGNAGTAAAALRRRGSASRRSNKVDGAGSDQSRPPSCRQFAKAGRQMGVGEAWSLTRSDGAQASFGG